MDNFFDNNRILKSIWNWKKHIAVVIFLSVIFSAIISSPLFIKPKFKSTARIYPVNITEASKESESEHLLENIQSIDLKFRMIEAFKLDEVYKISRNEKLYQTYMLYEFNKNVSFKKTSFETIEIKVLDTDPVRASNMVDSCIVFLNDMVREQRAQRWVELTKVYERDLQIKNREMDSIFNIIENIRRENKIIDYFTESETATRGLMDAAAMRGDKNPSLSAINSLIMKGGELRKYQEMLGNYEVMADTIKRRYDNALSKATMDISYCKVVQHPFPADKKSYPVRWLIVFMAVVGTTVASVITVSLIDYIREIRSTK